MDSLTQITLGAAVGEVVLGRKLGNRAMLWGAFGGTIPDFDVFIGAALSDIDALAFHRGITHSIFFSVAAAFPVAWLVWKLYTSDLYQNKVYQGIIAVINAVLMIALGFAIFSIFREAGLRTQLISGFILLCLVALFFRYLWVYFKGTPKVEATTLKEWYLLFFLAFFTHIILDSFTSYGTQVFQPFDNYRVAFDTISVVDPLFTVPFIICLIVVLVKRRDSRIRRFWNWLGIGLSCAYLLFTIINKMGVDRVFERSLQERGIEVERSRTSPTILNNLLWSCAAEGDSVYYQGLYSVFDSGDTLHHINMIPKNHTVMREYWTSDMVSTLRWFSNGYLAVTEAPDSIYVLSDLRFGAMRDTFEGYEDLVFNFRVKVEEGELEYSTVRDRPDDMSVELRRFWRRMWGRE